MLLEAPRITVYYRILSNITGQQIHDFADTHENTNINFGYINGLTGGESSAVVEFDIWNNEIAFTAGTMAESVSDAINCKFTAWDNAACVSTVNIKDSNNISYVKARNMVKGHLEPFKEIAGPQCLTGEDMIGNVSELALSTLSGRPGGDHTKIQSKIVIPAGTEPKMNNFVFSFQYDFI
jgi:hypothetical protein